MLYSFWVTLEFPFHLLLDAHSLVTERLRMLITRWRFHLLLRLNAYRSSVEVGPESNFTGVPLFRILGIRGCIHGRSRVIIS